VLAHWRAPRTEGARQQIIRAGMTGLEEANYAVDILSAAAEHALGA